MDLANTCKTIGSESVVVVEEEEEEEANDRKMLVR
jgi:hypothetical protein